LTTADDDDEEEAEGIAVEAVVRAEAVFVVAAVVAVVEGNREVTPPPLPRGVRLISK
jgi:hypothetical protein